MSRWFTHIDWLLVTPVFLLISLSLITLFSISTSYFLNQFLFSIVCCFVFLIFTHINLEDMQGLALPLYIFSLFALMIVLGIGFESHGAVRWIDIGGFRIQFSELLKPVLIFCLAVCISQRQNASLKTVALLTGFLLPVLFLIYKQPDLGNAVIYLGVFIITLLVYGLPLWWFIGGGVLLLLLVPFSFRFLHNYQKQRLLTFLHMTNDPLGTSYNAIQAIIAVGSGGFLGKGLGQGTQSMLRFLPERHTDFLFATLSEDLGFFGSFLVICIFTVLLVRIFIIFTDTQESVEKVFVLGAFALILIQFFINAGMNIGLLPIVGVTLPFMSYGGSSLLSNTILLAVVSSIAQRSKTKHSLVIT